MRDTLIDVKLLEITREDAVRRAKNQRPQNPLGQNNLKTQEVQQQKEKECHKEDIQADNQEDNETSDKMFENNALLLPAMPQDMVLLSRRKFDSLIAERNRLQQDSTKPNVPSDTASNSTASSVPRRSPIQLPRRGD